jgi:hypothetical protein
VHLHVECFHLHWRVRSREGCFHSYWSLPAHAEHFRLHQLERLQVWHFRLRWRVRSRAMWLPFYWSLFWHVEHFHPRWWARLPVVWSHHRWWINSRRGARLFSSWLSRLRDEQAALLREQRPQRLSRQCLQFSFCLLLRPLAQTLCQLSPPRHELVWWNCYDAMWLTLPLAAPGSLLWRSLSLSVSSGYAKSPASPAPLSQEIHALLTQKIQMYLS